MFTNVELMPYAVNSTALPPTSCGASSVTHRVLPPVINEAVERNTGRDGDCVDTTTRIAPSC
eukprot:2278357-Alexandrium_andersonii.AAC.1